MATIRPETREITGTLREISGFTDPVAINFEVVVRAAAAASGKCSGCSTVNRLTFMSCTTVAGGGASAAASTCELHPLRARAAGMHRRRRPIFSAWFVLREFICFGRLLISAIMQGRRSHGERQQP